MSHDEMISFLYEVTRVFVSLNSINQALRAMYLSKRSRHHVARLTEAEQRSLYLYRLSRYETNQIIFVDQSGYDEKNGSRMNDWRPCDEAKVHYAIGEATFSVSSQILENY